MRAVFVTPSEALDIEKLAAECRGFDKFDEARWAVGLACLFGMSVEELRERAGNFPDGSMTEVVVVPELPADRWVP